MTVCFSSTQKRRLKELGVGQSQRDRLFDTTEERDGGFQQIEKSAINVQRRLLARFRQEDRRPRLCRLENALAEMLAGEGFVQLTTPIMMSRSSLEKMGIDKAHPLNSQVFWLDEKKCLRPMLAPHLYAVARDLLRIWDEPVRIFEIGPCFRKESQGARHTSEFTMLNLAEFGVTGSSRRDRIKALASRVMACADISDYKLTLEHSEVYGDTLDIVGMPDDLELGSSAMGPHPLDQHWRIITNWVGIGFGLERLLMAGDPDTNMSRVARSLAYLDGTRLTI